MSRLRIAVVVSMLLVAAACAEPAMPADWPLPEVRLPRGARAAVLGGVPIAPDHQGRKWSAAFECDPGWTTLIRHYDARLKMLGYEPYDPLAGFGRPAAATAEAIPNRLYTATDKPFRVLLTDAKALGSATEPEVGDFVLTILEVNPPAAPAAR